MIYLIFGEFGFVIEAARIKITFSTIYLQVNHTAVAEMGKKHNIHHDDDEAHITSNATGEGEVDECGNVATKEDLTVSDVLIVSSSRDTFFSTTSVYFILFFFLAFDFWYTFTVFVYKYFWLSLSPS